VPGDRSLARGLKKSRASPQISCSLSLQAGGSAFDLGAAFGDSKLEKDDWMRRIAQVSLLSGGLLTLAAAGVLWPAGLVQAASPKVQAAIKSLEKIEADGAKFQSFCKLLRDLDDVPEQEAEKAEALDVQLENLLRSIGFDVLQAWDLGADLDPQSEDGQAFETAMQALEDKCPD
jgi:hypothetical protein